MPKRPTSNKPAPARSAPHVHTPTMPAYTTGSEASNTGYAQTFGGPFRDPNPRATVPGNTCGLVFHPSPFYNINCAITDVLTCPSKFKDGMIFRTLAPNHIRLSHDAAPQQHPCHY